MRRIFLPFAILLSAVVLCSSCLGDDDDEYDYYDDTAITAFSLGTLNQYLHTTSSTGADSTYKKTIAGSNYKFYIDQQKREIYNPDSLPIGTDAEHVICTISTRNSGTVVIKNIDSDTLQYYSSTDSIDFSSPRTVHVIAQSGKARRTYTIHVNVHQEEADTFIWKRMEASATGASLISKMKGMKAVACNGAIYLFGNTGSQTEMLVSTNGTDWGVSNGIFSADAYQNVFVKDNALYMLDRNWMNQGSVLLKMTDSQWVHQPVDSSLKRLVAVTRNAIYAQNEDNGLMASYDGGVTWTAETLGDDAASFPTENIHSLTAPIRTNPEIERIVLTGSRSLTDYPSDRYNMVWGKLEDTASNLTTYDWTFYNPDYRNIYQMPRLSNMAITYYDDAIFALGGSGMGACTEAAFSQLYISRDGGITWKKEDCYPLPEGLTVNNNVFALTADSDNYLWIICGSGQIWRGRLNRLGWASEQTSFTE